MKNQNVKVMTSSEKMTWGTPQKLFDKLNKMYGPFDLDAAASKENAKCNQYYSESDDSLKMSWITFSPPTYGYAGMPELPPPPQVSRVWLNPPYGRGIGKWLKKAAEEAQKGATVVCLVPSRTGSAWFQNAVSEASELLFLKGRVVFETSPGVPVLDKKGKPMAAPFDNVVIVFKPNKQEEAKISWYNWKE